MMTTQLRLIHHNRGHSVAAACSKTCTNLCQDRCPVPTLYVCITAAVCLGAWRSYNALLIWNKVHRLLIKQPPGASSTCINDHTRGTTMNAAELRAPDILVITSDGRSKLKRMRERRSNRTSAPPAGLVCGGWSTEFPNAHKEKAKKDEEGNAEVMRASTHVGSPDVHRKKDAGVCV
ncbi:hypothetical protein OH76DRAFT_1550414 [Lentinus brumalis]|uniref:Uncharacterized protein n=1 Tax=Lentinus brumalis TaxID=2498619 RepID=A0A371DWX7_9APHY|nr:hypothetical protein OH76DRAFT_1550414 [Polyporus brumalis]